MRERERGGEKGEVEREWNEREREGEREVDLRCWKEFILGNEHSKRMEKGKNGRRKH